MITAAKLAGLFAAHAIWCVCDGETLVPMLAHQTNDSEKKMERLLIDDDLEASVEYGKDRLASNEMDANDAVLLYDGRIPIGSEKIDAIIIEMRTYSSPGSEAVLAIPYTPKQSGMFRVHRPKLLGWTNCESFDMNAYFEAFWEGVGDHAQGSKLWSDCLDESK